MEPEVNGRHSHPLIQVFFFSCLCYFPPSLALLIVGCHGNKSIGGGSIIEAVVGLVVSWELDIVKWSDSCTHKQRVRWSRREVEGAGGEGGRDE